MLVEGQRINKISNRCFLAVFRAPQLTSDTGVSVDWVLGTIVMQHYYTVFDATGEMLRLGFGKRAKRFELFEGEEDKEKSDEQDKIIITTIILFTIMIAGGFVLCVKLDDNKDKTFKQPTADPTLVMASQAQMSMGDESLQERLFYAASAADASRTNRHFSMN